MSTVSFTLNEGLAADEQDRVIGLVVTLPGVKRAMPIKPNARHPIARRRCFAEVSTDNEVDLLFLVEQMLSIPGVKTASIPAKRYALTG